MNVMTIMVCMVWVMVRGVLGVVPSHTLALEIHIVHILVRVAWEGKEVLTRPLVEGRSRGQTQLSRQMITLTL